MKFKGRNWFFGGIILIAIQLGSVIVLNAQTGGQALKTKDKVRAVCHFTGNASSPYELITVGAGASHAGHGDVKPENGACPSVLPMSWSGRSGKNKTARGNNKGSADSSTTGTSLASTSAPQTLGTTNAETGSAEDGKKVSICHREGNGEYHLITVSENAAPAHLAHGDMLPDGVACDSGNTGGTDAEPGATPEPVTMLLFGAGIAGVGYVARRRRSRSENDPI